MLLSVDLPDQGRSRSLHQFLLFFICFGLLAAEESAAGGLADRPRDPSMWKYSSAGFYHKEEKSVTPVSPLMRQVG